MPAAQITVTRKGPIFSPKAPRELQIVGNKVVQNLVELGEEHISQLARPRPSGVFLSVSQAQKGQASKGHYSRSVQGEARGMRGEISLGQPAVIYGAWLEGTSTRNKTTRFKGYGIFRKTTTWLQGQVKGVLKQHMSRAMRNLGGRSGI